MEKKTVKNEAGKTVQKTAKTDKKAQPKDLLDVLLDQENKDPIVLMDTNGRQITFEQVAIIPYDVPKEERRLYVILKPIDKIDGIADDEAVVFVCDQDKDGSTVLKVEENEEIAIAVFDKFYDLLEEAAKSNKKAKKEAKPAAKTTKVAGKTAGKSAGKESPKTAPKTASKPVKTTSKPAAKATPKKK